jgi:hypothetical protein
MSQEDWSYISRELEKEWSSTPLSHSHPWEEIQDDVRFGWEQAMSPEFSGAQWDDVSDLLQQRWEESYPHPGYEDWRIVGEAVRLGFNRAKEQVS